jgi:hypothetical protein
LCLGAPEAVEVPHGLLRADGRSVYQRHGGVGYIKRAQLAMEERMLAQARAGGAGLHSRMPRGRSARTRSGAGGLLGAEAPGDLLLGFAGTFGWPGSSWEHPRPARNRSTSSCGRQESQR